MTGGTKEKFFSLSQISAGIRDAIYMQFGERPIWIVAEISDLNIRKGHCYLSLVEKLPGNAAPVCELKGIVWANKFERINKTFSEVTGTNLASNTNILFQAVIRYDVKWGLSLVIEDIEPKYTVGLLQQERERTVAKLKSEGVYQNNKKTSFPLAPMRVAVISAKDSRGYEDFLEKLKINQHGYNYKVTLFPSLLQGDKAASEMVSRLISIFENINDFDIVVIVRGGGGAIDLNCFNDYKLARAVARFPIPILTGIGHTANISIVDEVAYADRITPTDAADYIVEKTVSFEELLDDLSTRVQEAAVDIILENEQYLFQKSNLFRLLISQKLSSAFQSLSNTTIQINNATRNLIKRSELSLITQTSRVQRVTRNQILLQEEKLKQYTKTIKTTPFQLLLQDNNKMNHLETSVNHLNPVNILKRGFSITQLNGKSVSSSKNLNEGDIIKTTFYEGFTESEVKKRGN